MKIICNFWVGGHVEFYEALGTRLEKDSIFLVDFLNVFIVKYFITYSSVAMVWV
jgi:hypothetical protein